MLTCEWRSTRERHGPLLAIELTVASGPEIERPPCSPLMQPQGHRKMLDQLHDYHPGISPMKSLARSVVWRPGINRQIEEKVKKCCLCEEHQKTPAQAPLHPWDWPSRPWARVHVDHAGPFMGRMFLLLVDAHSKWLEA